MHEMGWLHAADHFALLSARSDGSEPNNNATSDEPEATSFASPLSNSAPMLICNE